MARTNITEIVEAINNAAGDRMEAAKVAYDAAAAQFVADPAAGIEVMQAYRAAFYAELDAAEADAMAAMAVFEPCEFVVDDEFPAGAWVQS